MNEDSILALMFHNAGIEISRPVLVTRDPVLYTSIQHSLIRNPVSSALVRIPALKILVI